MQRKDITILKNNPSSTTVVRQFEKDQERVGPIYTAVWKPGFKHITVRCKKQHCLFTIRFSYQTSMHGIPVNIKFLHIGTLNHRFPVH